MKIFLTVISVLLFLIVGDSTFSQTTNSGLSNPESSEKNEFQISAGGSLFSGTVIGSTEDARFGSLSLRYARIFKPGRKVALKYTVDVTPVNVLSYNTFRLENQGGNNLVVRRVRENSYGVGVAPLGLQVNFRRREKIQPFVGSSGGFIYFTKRVPNEFGARFNFTADVGGGVQFMLKNKKAVTLGYKYQHLSNGDRGLSNPGFDSNIFYVGYSIFK